MSRFFDRSKIEIVQSGKDFFLVDSDTGEDISGGGFLKGAFNSFKEAARVLELMIAEDEAADKAEADEARFQAWRDREIDR